MLLQSCFLPSHFSFLADAAASPASSGEGQMKQLNLMVRTRSDSGKELSDAVSNDVNFFLFHEHCLCRV